MHFKILQLITLHHVCALTRKGTTYSVINNSNLFSWQILFFPKNRNRQCPCQSCPSWWTGIKSHIWRSEPYPKMGNWVGHSVCSVNHEDLSSVTHTNFEQTKDYGVCSSLSSGVHCMVSVTTYRRNTERQNGSSE